MASASNTSPSAAGPAEDRSGGASPAGVMRPAKLFLGGLTRNTTTKQLRDHFAQYGRVLDCVAMRHPDGRPRGFGYVTLDSPSAAERCVQEPQVIDGRVIDMKRAVPGNACGGGGSPSFGADRAAATPKLGRDPRHARQTHGPAFFPPPEAWELAAAAACMGFPGSPAQTASAAAWASWLALAAARSPSAASPTAIFADHQGAGVGDATPMVTPSARGSALSPLSSASPQKVALPSALKSHRSVFADITNRGTIPEDAKAAPSSPWKVGAGKENACTLPSDAVAPRAKLVGGVALQLPPGLSPPRRDWSAEPALWLASPVKLDSIFATTPRHALA